MRRLDQPGQLWRHYPRVSTHTVDADAVHTGPAGCYSRCPRNRTSFERSCVPPTEYTRRVASRCGRRHDAHRYSLTAIVAYTATHTHAGKPLLRSVRHRHCATHTSSAPLHHCGSRSQPHLRLLGSLASIVAADISSTLRCAPPQIIPVPGSPRSSHGQRLLA